jgi:signal transduction histidine kinase
LINPFIKRVLHAGASESTSESRARAIILCNTIAVIAITLSLVFLIYAAQNGWGTTENFICGAIAVMASIPYLNARGLTNLSRLLLPLVIPVMSLLLVILVRMNPVGPVAYVRNPGIFCVILVMAVMPILMFSTREKKWMFGSLVINFLLFASIDIILRYYSDLHAWPTLSQYFSGNLSMLIAYALLVASVLSLKEITDEYELRNLHLIRNLNRKNEALEKANRDLQELNNDIETQNEEIQSQSEELLQSQDSLLHANREIERQNIKLEQQNELLSKTLDEKSNDLLLTNQQLVAHNNELQQFSYTVSHNLRGPVASMLGLINVHKHASTDSEASEILKLLEQSTRSLETVIHDLNKIIEIRNDKFSNYENISLEKEVQIIRQSLNPFITSNHARIETDFQLGEIISVKAYINSILYNLISNGIQYRSYDRSPVIKITSRKLNETMLLECSDNGLGIDLRKFKGDLFKLYKRFHTHTQGKGLGLYLVKQQVEKLQGKIDIDSKLNEGTTFTITLPLLKA